MKNLKDCVPKNDKEIQKAQEELFRKETSRETSKVKTVIILIVILTVFLFLANTLKNAENNLPPDSGSVHTGDTD